MKTHVGWALLVAGSLCGACGPKQDAKATTLATADTSCPDGFEVGPSDSCFAIPSKSDATTPIVIFLHDAHDAKGVTGEWSMAHAAVDKGFAVITVRGKRDACALRPELASSYCWPHEAEDPQAAKQVVAGWDKVLWQVDALLEQGTHKRYVMGVGDGGAFASFLAARNIFPAQGWAVVNGGQLEPVAKSRTSAFVLVSAPSDASKMKELHDSLAKSGWMHAMCMRGGDHSMTAEDLDASLSYFRHDVKSGEKPPYPCEGGTKPSP